MVALTASSKRPIELRTTRLSKQQLSSGMSFFFLAIFGALFFWFSSRPSHASAPTSTTHLRSTDSDCQQELPHFFRNIQEKSIFSQNGEDGVIEALLGRFGSDKHKYYVEFGTEKVIAGQVGEINTRVLREQKGYSGLLMDGNNENPDVNQHKEIIKPSNINQLFEKYHVPEEFNLLSIDIDFDDWWVWQSIDPKYRPRVVITEYNSKLGPVESKVVNLKDARRWTGSDHFGASFQAMKRMASYKGYTLVYGESMGVNLFYVRTDLLNCPGLELKDSEIYAPPKYGPEQNGHPFSSNDRNRKFIVNPDPAKFPSNSYPPEPIQ